MHIQRRTKHPRAGVVMAEFAIMLPVFVLIMVGMIEFGRAVMIHQILVNATREGARLAVIPGATNAQVTSRVEEWLVTLNAPGRQIAITDESGNAIDLASTNPHNVVRISVSVPYNEVGVGITSLFANSTVGSHSQMRKE